MADTAAPVPTADHGEESGDGVGVGAGVGGVEVMARRRMSRMETEGQARAMLEQTLVSQPFSADVEAAMKEVRYMVEWRPCLLQWWHRRCIRSG